MQKGKRRYAAPVAVAAALMLAPPAALGASTASVSGTVLTYTGDAGASDLTLAYSGGRFTLDDAGTITPGAGCARVKGKVTCDFVTSVVIDLGDGDDAATSMLMITPVTMRGGAGNDTLTGGSNPDLLYGDAGTDILTGGAGDDQLDGGAEGDTVSGDAGADAVMARDDAVDLVGCGTEADSVIADTADSVAADCEAVERPAPDPEPPDTGGDPDPEPPDTGGDPDPEPPDTGGNSDPEPPDTGGDPDPGPPDTGTGPADPGGPPSDGEDTLPADEEDDTPPVDEDETEDPADEDDAETAGEELAAEVLTLEQGAAVAVSASGVVGVPVGCPVGVEGGCSGTVTLSFPDGVAKLTASRRRKSRKARKVGSSRFTVAAGTAKTVQVRLSRRGRRTVRRRRRVGVVVRLALKTGDTTATVTRSATLRLARRGRRR